MYAICDNMRILSEAFFYPCSYTEALIRFRLKNPGVTSCNVYRDLSGKNRCSDLQYISTLNKKTLDKIFSYYLSKIGRSSK